jgi:alkyl sulfatase BDS1-like metallo-beta-lactamase superfamily hydrolase
MQRMIGCTKARAALAVLLMLATGGTLTAQEFAGREKLRAHSGEFRKDVIKITDGVYVAVGFSNANSILIQGDGGSIIVDTTSDVTDASAVKAEFAKLSAAPVRAIIYTHSHPAR